MSRPPGPARPADQAAGTRRGSRPLGRRPGAADTRTEILAAARGEFAAHGYDGTTVRGIARAAGVDPALIHHYFGTKEQVFIAAMALPFRPADVIGALLSERQEGVGARVAGFFFQVWGRAESREPLLAMLRSATTNEAAAAMLREFVASTILARVDEVVELPDARLRVELAVGVLLGTAMLRYVLRTEPLASAPEEAVIALVAPVIDRYLAP